MQRSAFCRSRRELSNAYLLTTFGFDTAENEPCKVWPIAALAGSGSGVGERGASAPAAGASVGSAGRRPARRAGRRAGKVRSLLLHCSIGQILQGSFSSVSKPNFASKYAFESSRRDLRNALLCTAFGIHNRKLGGKIAQLCNLNFFQEFIIHMAKFCKIL